jgi:hypothetical protein
MDVLHKIAIADGYVEPSFLRTLKEIERECQAYRCEQIATRLIELNPELQKTEVE